MGQAGSIVLGSPDRLRAWWFLVLASPISVGLFSLQAGAPWPAAAAVLAGFYVVWLWRRFSASQHLGAFSLRADGNWVARRDGRETVFKPMAVMPWPGAVLVDFRVDRTRYAMAISARSAGVDAFRRLQVRIRDYDSSEAEGM
jgi:hypothetical protein